MITTTIILWVHIFGAIGWLGAAMLFAMVIGPTLPKLSPQARGEVMLKIVPKFTRYIEGFSVLTIIAGPLTVVAIFNGNLSEFSLSTAFGLYITIGAVLALVAVGLAVAVILPTTRKIVAISEALAKAPGPPPPELAVASNRLRVSSTLGLVILILVTIFMVAGATL